MRAIENELGTLKESDSPKIWIRILPYTKLSLVFSMAQFTTQQGQTCYETAKDRKRNAD